MLATIDRRAAAAEARIALATDAANERLAHIERRAAELAGPILDEMDSLFRRARELIGRGGDDGTLAAAIERAEATVTDCNDAAARLGALIGHAAAA